MNKEQISDNNLKMSLFNNAIKKRLPSKTFDNLTEQQSKELLSRLLVGTLFLMKSMAISIKITHKENTPLAQGVQEGFMSALAPVYSLFTKEQIKAWLQEEDNREQPITSAKEFELFEKIANCYIEKENK